MATPTTGAPAGGAQSASSSAMGWVGFGIQAAQLGIQMLSAGATVSAAGEAARLQDTAILRSTLSTVDRINAERATKYAQISAARASLISEQRQATGSTKAAISAYGMQGGTARALLADNEMKASTALATIDANRNLLDAQLQWKTDDAFNAARAAFVGQHATSQGPSFGAAFAGNLMQFAAIGVQNYKGDLFKDATKEFNDIVSGIRPSTTPTTTGGING
jgi:hypothetical protein